MIDAQFGFAPDTTFHAAAKQDDRDGQGLRGRGPVPAGVQRTGVPRELTGVTAVGVMRKPLPLAATAQRTPALSTVQANGTDPDLPARPEGRDPLAEVALEADRIGRVLRDRVSAPLRRSFATCTSRAEVRLTPSHTNWCAPAIPRSDLAFARRTLNSLTFTGPLETA